MARLHVAGGHLNAPLPSEWGSTGDTPALWGPVVLAPVVAAQVETSSPDAICRAVHMPPDLLFYSIMHLQLSHIVLQRSDSICPVTHLPLSASDGARHSVLVTRSFHCNCRRVQHATDFDSGCRHAGGCQPPQPRQTSVACSANSMPLRASLCSGSSSAAAVTSRAPALAARLPTSVAVLAHWTSAPSALPTCSLRRILCSAVTRRCTTALRSCRQSTACRRSHRCASTFPAP